jgi:ribosomal protein L16/L10AE
MLNKKNLKPYITNINKWNIKNNFNIYPYISGISSTGFCFLKKNQIEACRKVISRFLKTLYKRPMFKISMNFKTAITKKSLGARMGRGKGSVSEYVYKLNKNNLLFEFYETNKTILNIILNKIKPKLPVNLEIINLYKGGYCRYKDRIIR